MNDEFENFSSLLKINIFGGCDNDKMFVNVHVIGEGE